MEVLIAHWTFIWAVRVQPCKTSKTPNIILQSQDGLKPDVAALGKDLETLILQVALSLTEYHNDRKKKIRRVICSLREFGYDLEVSVRKNIKQVVLEKKATSLSLVFNIAVFGFTGMRAAVGAVKLERVLTIVFVNE